MATRIDLWKNIARNLSDLIVDAVPASMTASTIDLPSLLQPNSNQLTGRYLYIYAGAGVDQSKIVGSYNPTLKRLAIPDSFGSVPSINSNFIITSRFSVEDINHAISRYVGLARQRNLMETVGTSTIVGTQYEYPVPSGMRFVNNIRVVPSMGSDYNTDIQTRVQFEIPLRDWRIEPTVDGSYVISIDRRKLDLGPLDGHYISIMGQSRPFVGTVGTSVIPEPLEEYIIAGASAQLASTLFTSDGKIDPRFYYFRDQVSGRPGPSLEDYITSTPRGKAVG
jgi:hypothetical protein